MLGVYGPLERLREPFQDFCHIPVPLLMALDLELDMSAG